MNQEEKAEYEASARFMNQALLHIDKATDKQKLQLLQLLLQRPPENQALVLAESIWSGLSEKEFMQLMARLQKQFDKEFWLFSTRWR